MRIFTRFLFLRHKDIFYCVQLYRYYKLKMMLKSETADYVPKKAKVFEKDEIGKFFADAPDDNYLLMKVGIVSW